MTRVWQWLLVLLIPAVVQAAQPARFNYQAILKDGDGALLEGAHTLHIGLWEGGTAGAPNSGSLLYGETANVTAAGGVVNHVIGTGTPTGSPLAAADLDTDADVFVQVAVDTVGNVVLPRTQLQPVPYAVEAETAESALNGVPSGTVILGTTQTAPAGFTWLGTELSSSWQIRSPLPNPRSQCAGAVVQDKVCIAGGLSGFQTPAAEVRLFTPALNQWVTTTPLPTARAGLTLTEAGGMLYAIGGHNGLITSPYALNERLDPATGSWLGRQPMTIARSGHAAAAANGRVYVFGGVDAAGNPIASVAEYNPATNDWTAKADLPTSRALPAAATVDSKIFVMGGYYVGAQVRCDMYDPALNSWTPKAPMPFALYDHTAASLNGKVYVVGGQRANAEFSMDCLIYDPQTDSWSSGPTMPNRKGYHGSAAIGGRVYAGGGNADFSGDATDEFFSWSPGLYYPWVKD